MKRFLSSTACAVVLALSPDAYGQGIPTQDTAAIAQAAAQHAQELQQMAAQHTAELAELLNQLEEMNRIYENAQQQLLQLKAQYKSLTDIRNLSRVFNRSSTAVSNFEFGTYIDLAKYAIGESGSVPAKVGVVIERAKLSTGLYGLEDLYESSLARDRRIAEQAGAGLSVMAMSEVAMDDYKEDGHRLDEIMSEVGQQADLKAAIDYNTAVTVEVARLLNKMVLMQAMQAQVSATEATLSAAGSIASRKFTDRVEGN